MVIAAPSARPFPVFCSHCLTASTPWLPKQLKDVTELARKLTRDYVEDEDNPKNFLKISDLQEMQGASIEEVMKLIFEGLDIGFMAIYEGTDGKGSSGMLFEHLSIVLARMSLRARFPTCGVLRTQFH
jgi:hypothetical protein